MSETILVIGYGPVGAETAQLLAARGQNVIVAQRKRPPGLPEAIPFEPCDVERRDSLRQAARGASQIVLAVGLPYSGPIWRDLWPKIIDNVVETAAETGARVVFVDNLYMYGPQREPLRETMPLTTYGIKPAARATATRVWQRAAGRVRFAAVRGPDFYGPGVTLSVLGETGLGALAKGKAALWFHDADLPHEIAYVPDFARAVVTLLDAPDDAFGQAWHVPCAPTRSGREILALGAKALGAPLRVRNTPRGAGRALGLINPTLAGFPEQWFQWDRPYFVDASKFAARFWSDATPFEEGVARAAHAFRERAAA